MKETIQHRRRAINQQISVPERIRRALADLTSSETKVARHVLASSGAGLGSSAQLGAKAGVSAPTVTRFARRLGFHDYAEFRAALIEDVTSRLQSPVRNIDDRPGNTNGAQRWSRLSGTVSDAVAAVPDAELETAANLFASPKARVFSVGGLHSHVCARHLAGGLRQLRAQVQHVDQSPAALIEMLSCAKRPDVVALFDYRRYEARLVQVAEQLHRTDVRIVLFTDHALSPVANVANAVISAPVEAGLLLDTLVPAFAQVEMLVEQVATILGTKGHDRLQRWTSTSDTIVERWLAEDDPTPDGGS